MNNTRVVVTGANGFVGQHLCRALAVEGYRVTGFVRSGADVSYLKTIRNLDLVVVDDYDNVAKYSDSLCGVDTVVHLAARVHVLHDKVKNPLEEFRRVNVLTTRRIATAAAATGVRRCVYVSSIKVNGETTDSQPFEPDDPPRFSDPYGQSKWEAEEVLREIAASSGMEWAVVRPPLIYGPGVRGNFLALLKITKIGIPLPLGAIVNRRSLVSVFNFVDLLKTMLHHPRAAGNRFLVKDGEDVSTSDLIRHIAEGMKRRPYLVPVPTKLLMAMGRLASREELITRLCSSLVVNTEKTKNELEWTAPMPLATGIVRTCDWFSVTASGRAS